MTVQQRALLDRLFEGAVGLPPERQPAFLSQNCPDPAVLQELESLLTFASRPLEGMTEAIEQVAGSLAAPDFMDQRVGPYRLTGRIGQGGMGAVYGAVRDDDQFQQTVAIKMLRFPDGDPAMLQRFRHERQILASLEHPYIARLLDGGAWVPPGSAESQPYIVMEFVEGLPLTAYCEAKKLTIRQRLVLFRQICDALSYAHRQLVIHRDIKPANILVTSDGTPKLLDFGVAKLLDPEMGHGAGTRTSTGLLAMTPDYASPEQVRGEPVSTVTDVYSLGAVLYELLTGRRPHQLATYDPLEIAREICEREVPPPGIGVDPDVIVLKALQKEPVRRYQSAEQFSEDVRRYLEGLPIAARPDTAMYRTMKFVQRHWLGLGAVAAVFVALVGGIGVSTWEARRADTEAATAKAVNEFLQNDLLAQASAKTQAGPNTKPDPHLEVRTALDRAAARIEGKFAGRPAVEAAIRRTIGNTYSDLGLLAEAQRQLERAIELNRKTLGDEAAETLHSLNDLAELYWTQAKYADAAPLWNKLLQSQRRALGEEHPDTLRTVNNLAALSFALGKYPEAESLFARALAVQRRKLGSDHEDTLSTMNNLGLLYTNRANYAAAEPLLTEVLERKGRVLGEEHPDTLSSMANLARLYEEQGKYAMAEALMRRVLEVRQRVRGEQHPETLAAMNNLGRLYGGRGDYAGAEALLSKAVDGRRRGLGEQHISTLVSMRTLAIILRDEGKYERAEALHTKALEIARRVLGEEHRETLSSASDLGRLYLSQGRYAAAESLLGKVVEAERRVLGPDDIGTTKGLASLGEAWLFEQKYPEAELPLREAFANYEKLNSGIWGRYDTHSLLGASLAGQKKYAEAEPLLLSGYRGLLERQTTMPADSRWVVELAGERIVRLYRDWGRPEEAAKWRENSHREPR